VLLRVLGAIVDYLYEYIATAAIAEQKKEPLFRTSEGRSRKLTNNTMSRHDAICMVKRRARDAGVSEKIGCHTFRATGITNYLQKHLQGDRLLTANLNVAVRATLTGKETTCSGSDLSVRGR
jgi:hypothetical protein